MWSPEWWSGWLPSGAFGSTWATSRSLDSARGAPQRRRRRGRRHVQAADDGRAGSPSCCPALDAAFRPTCSPVVRGFVAATAGAPTVDILMADYDLLVLRPAPGGHDRRGHRGDVGGRQVRQGAPSLPTTRSLPSPTTPHISMSPSACELSGSAFLT